MTQEIVTQTHDPMLAMIERVALSPDADISKLEKMLDMQERVLARDAKQVFYSAFADMQSEIPDIAERATGHNLKYASLEDINEQVKPILKKHGFGILFKISQPDAAKILITGVLSHRGGHAEETSMLLPSDTSGAKNAVQALGSSTSYGEDDNGAASESKPVTAFQQNDITGILRDCSEKTREWFMETYGSESQIPKDQYNAVRAKLIKARDAAKKGA